jgi:uncharacterized membrane protein YbhN (UPF0104 family)
VVETRKIVSTLGKLAISAVLIGYLVSRAARDDQFTALLTAPKNWAALLAALPVCLFAVTVTILRWHILIRAIGLSFSTRETLRAGYLGYLANLLPFGLVAGDSLKAVMLIHRNPRRKTDAVASVIVDRALGLFSLLLLAAAASLLLPAEQLDRLSREDRTQILRLCRLIQLAAAAGSAAMIVMLIPGLTNSRWWDLLEHTPMLGRILHKLVGAMRAYRQRVDLMLAAVIVSMLVHTSYIGAFALMTRSIGIPAVDQPAVSSMFVIVPPSMVAGALPIGTLEIVFTLLFRAASPPTAAATTGLLIALTYRLLQISIASIGAIQWIAGRGDVRALMHEAEDSTPPEIAGHNGKPAALVDERAAP